MGIWDWLGPLNVGNKRRGWDALPSLPTERKEHSWTQQDLGAAITVNTLVHGPGATELLRGWRQNDGNSAVWACLQAIATAYVEAPIHAYRQTSPKDREPRFDSPLEAFLQDVNPAFDLLELMAWVQIAKRVDGNAFLRKLRSGDPETGNVVQLWPISPSKIEPVTTRGSGDFISFYRYHRGNGRPEEISVENVVHFRMGIDDQDHRRGCSDLKRLVREVSSDDQATRYADQLLSNLAIPGLSLEFPADAKPIDQPTADMLKARITAAYSGTNIGSTAVLSPGAKLVSHGFSPEQLDLKTLHLVPEERISAVLRVPAIVAGLGAGLARSTFANYKEAREAFTEGTVLPSYQSDDRTLTKHLARDFSSDRRDIIAHDISMMRALQDDEDKKATRLKTYVEAGILDEDEARAELGREPRSAVPTDAGAPGGPPGTRSRPRLISVGRERKAADDLPGRFATLREKQASKWDRDLEKFLDDQLKRVNRALRSGGDDALELVAEGEVTLLGEVLEPLQLRMFEDVQRLVIAELGIEFEVDDAMTRRYLQACGVNIQRITDTTRQAVRAALLDGQMNGEGIPDLARRIRELPEFGQARAKMVARTELGHSQIEGALASYRASGVVVGVKILDGDEDTVCAGRDGTVMSLDAAGGTPNLAHPNCTAAFAPITDLAELRRSA